MDKTRHVLFVTFLSLAIVAAGTTGYVVIEGWNAIDALYMTIITVTTVGYSEVRDLSTLGRLYTILLIFTGFGFFVYVGGTVVQFIVEGQVQELLGRRRLKSQLNKLSDHYIVCGYGRIGRMLCRILRQKPIDLVVIDKDPGLVTAMEEDKTLYLSGDASDEKLLLKAGIERAKVLVAALATDTDNVFLVLTARQLNPDLEIIARAGGEDAKAKLKAAGANRVESPYEMGAASMAQRIMRPTVTNFLNLALSQGRKDIQMEEIPISSESPLAGVMLKDSGIRQNLNLIIIAIKQMSGEMLFNPSFEAQMNPGETVVAVGEEKNLKQLEQILNPGKAANGGGSLLSLNGRSKP